MLNSSFLQQYLLTLLNYRIMSYEMFQKCVIGTVQELSVFNGVIKFVKSGYHHWLVEYAVLTSGSVTYPRYTRLTTVLPEIEAFCLFDASSK